MPSLQVAPLRQGFDVHSLMLVAQFVPVYPGLQVMTAEPVVAVQIPFAGTVAVLHGLAVCVCACVCVCVCACVCVQGRLRSKEAGSEEGSAKEEKDRKYFR